jgi:hypothetical protein
MDVWSKRLTELLKVCKDRGIKVKFVPNEVTEDFIGMNPEAAKDMGNPMPKNTFYVDDWLGPKSKYDTLRHELIEFEYMKKTKKHYWPAHKFAMKDDITKPLVLP